jgi:hypothetical protein
MVNSCWPNLDGVYRNSPGTTGSWGSEWEMEVQLTMYAYRHEGGLRT